MFGCCAVDDQTKGPCAENPGRFPVSLISSQFSSTIKWRQHTKAINSARQTRDTRQTPGSPTVPPTWRASSYKVHKLHQRYILLWGVTVGDSELCCCVPCLQSVINSLCLLILHRYSSLHSASEYKVTNIASTESDTDLCFDNTFLSLKHDLCFWLDVSMKQSAWSLPCTFSHIFSQWHAYSQWHT